MAASGPTRFWVDCVHIRFFGNGGLWFRPYGESLWQTPQRNQRSGPLRSAPRCGSAFLRSGIHPGASPTVCFAAPPLDACGCAARSLRSHPRINPSTQPPNGAGTSKAVLELTLIVLSGGRPKPKRKPKPKPKQEWGCMCFETRVHLGISRRRTSFKLLGRFPLPLGEG